MQLFRGKSSDKLRLADGRGSNEEAERQFQQQEKQCTFRPDLS